MPPLRARRMPVATLLTVLFTTALFTACGGGDTGPTIGSQAVMPSTPTSGIDATAAAALPASAASEAASAADAAHTSRAPWGAADGASAQASQATAATTARPHSSAAQTATAAGSSTPGAAGAVVAAAPTVRIQAATTAQAPTVKPAAAAESGPVSAPCNLDQTRYFGSACFAAVTTKLGHGASAIFANAKPGYRGSTQAVCKGGTVTWTQESCTAAVPLTAPVALAAGDKNAASTQGVAAAAPPNYQIGVYYFGGWKDNQVGAPAAKPWERLVRYPDREPSLGMYAEDAPGVMSQQLKWMRQYGIDFVVFNWYWAKHNEPMLDHGLAAYLKLSDKQARKFAIQWSNHTETNFSRDQLDAMFRYWIANYFNRPDYQTFAGKPAVYIFLGNYWARNAKAVGLTSAQLIARLNNFAKAAGLPGVSVIGGLWGGDKTLDYSASNGFAALTMYNYHSPASIALQPPRPGNYSRSYAELHQSYANQWDWMVKNTSQPFIVPMSSGWDKRPWGGSDDPLHDDSRSTPAEFLVHLKAAKTFMDANATRTQRTGVVCCWNEFGEGSFVEPTKVDQFNYIQHIGSTFGAN